MPNNNQPNGRLGQTETMTRNNQDERQERLNRLLRRNAETENLEIEKNVESKGIETLYVQTPKELEI